METDKKKIEVEELKKDEDVRRELEQASSAKDEVAKPAVDGRQKIWLGTYIIVSVAFGVLYLLLRFGVFEFALRIVPILQKVSLGGLAMALLLTVAKIVPSFFGWIYILVKVPFKVGDRIKIGEATGDVIDVGYLDTTLWEFGGQHLSTDHPSGRIIKFPNSKVLNSSVYNYSWPLFPYIWNDIKFQIAYQSDLEFVARIMREAAAEEVGEAMMERVRIYRELLAQTPVDQLEVREYPAVVFRVSSNT